MLCKKHTALMPSKFGICKLEKHYDGTHMHLIADFPLINIKTKQQNHFEKRMLLFIYLYI